MDNMEAIIRKHNRKIINETPETTPQTACNCRKKDHCPLNNNCLSTCIIYNAHVTTTDDTTGKFYIGLTERTFKQRFNQHKLSFNSKNYANSTELSNYIWELKDTNKEYHIQWSIITSAASYFNIVIIEYAVKFMVLWEMFVYKLAEDSANIGLYTYVVWRVVPDYVALSFPFAVCG